MRQLLMMLSACAALTIIDNEARRMFVRLFRQAIRKADKTELQHCQNVGVKQSNWSAACAAQQPFSGEGLIQTETETWRWFSLLYLLAYGLPREVRLSAPIIKTMARMDLQPATTEERNAS